MIQKMEKASRDADADEDLGIDLSLPDDPRLVQSLQERCEGLLEECALRQFPLPGCYWNDGCISMEWRSFPEMACSLQLHSDCSVLLVSRQNPTGVRLDNFIRTEVTFDQCEEADRILALVCEHTRVG